MLIKNEAYKLTKSKHTHIHWIQNVLDITMGKTRKLIITQKMIFKNILIIIISLKISLIKTSYRLISFVFLEVLIHIRRLNIIK